MRSQRFEDRVQILVIEAQSGSSALTLVSALTLQLQRKMNNLGALVLLGCGSKPGMSNLWLGSLQSAKLYSPSSGHLPAVATVGCTTLTASKQRPDIIDHPAACVRLLYFFLRACLARTYSLLWSNGERSYALLCHGLARTYPLLWK